MVERLIAGALDALTRHCASDKNIELVRVPGAFELPLVVRRLAQSKRYDGIVAPENLHTSMPRDKPFVYGEFKAASTARIMPGKVKVPDAAAST